MEIGDKVSSYNRDTKEIVEEEVDYISNAHAFIVDGVIIGDMIRLINEAGATARPFRP